MVESRIDADNTGTWHQAMGWFEADAPHQDAGMRIEPPWSPPIVMSMSG
jgi:hypothetical protein